MKTKDIILELRTKNGAPALFPLLRIAPQAAIKG